LSYTYFRGILEILFFTLGGFQYLMDTFYVISQTSMNLLFA